MKTIWAVVWLGGGHEPLSVFSLWRTHEEAEREIARLKEAEPEQAYFESQEWPIGKSSDRYLN